ncbi:MAG TPA: CHASE4 domain-containing protein [Steroidobacteraceae bacterium]|nr:CHASE4 domain-containing protein [Steroidobacteraceae bacterium]
MNIRWKISILIATLFAVLAITELFVAKYVLMPSFTELERAQADVAMRRIGHSVNRSFEQLVQSATSWGNWSDTYRFAQDHNRHFIDENVTPIGLKQLDVNALFIVDLKGQIIASAALEVDSGKPLDLDSIRRRMLEHTFPWRDELRTGRIASGFIQTERGVLMLGASPILDGFGRGPFRGMVIMGKLLSAAEVAKIGAQAQARLSMVPAGWTGQRERIVETDYVTQVVEAFSDIYGRPIFSLEVDLQREITRRGYSAVHYASGYLIGAAVLAVALLVIILNRTVLDPLRRMTRHAVAIGQDKDLTSRLNFQGQDEIAVLAREFDRMVARVAHSRSQLVDQSFQAGFAELARGVLHNMGNAMTPISVRLSVLHGRLRDLQVEDFELAATELARGDVEPVRRADLEEFVRLACGQLTVTVKAAQQDLEIITRQTSMVQSALSEQMSSTRNDHVIESVHLADLLGQALDSVPDGARQQLDVQVDESLDEVGVVHIPRTVLRLVLQNFIINAAEAVRESGKPRGTLRISARIITDSESRQLVLRCSDDGVGIAPENLERIFDKGFSTKSRQTNFGIGLHWCANAVGALGGQVGATSPGAGGGAVFHVMVPLAAMDGRAMTRAA